MGAERADPGRGRKRDAKPLVTNGFAPRCRVVFSVREKPECPAGYSWPNSDRISATLYAEPPPGSHAERAVSSMRLRRMTRTTIAPGQASEYERGETSRQSIARDYVEARTNADNRPSSSGGRAVRAAPRRSGRGRRLERRRRPRPDRGRPSGLAPQRVEKPTPIRVWRPGSRPRNIGGERPRPQQQRTRRVFRGGRPGCHTRLLVRHEAWRYSWPSSDVISATLAFASPKSICVLSL